MNDSAEAMDYGRVIHKVQFRQEMTALKVPRGSFVPLHVAEQDGVPTLWYEVGKSPVAYKKITIQIVGTGENVPPNSDYLGTSVGEYYVWHLYQLSK